MSVLVGGQTGNLSSLSSGIAVAGRIRYVPEVDKSTRCLNSAIVTSLDGGVVEIDGVLDDLAGGAAGAIVGTMEMDGAVGNTAGGAGGTVAGTESQSGVAAGTAKGAAGTLAGTESQSGVIANGSAGAGSQVVGSEANVGSIADAASGSKGAVVGTIENSWESSSGSWDDQVITWSGDPGVEIIGVISSSGAGGSAEILAIFGQVSELIKELRLVKLQESDPRSLRIAIEEMLDKLNEVIRNLNPLLP